MTTIFNLHILIYKYKGFKQSFSKANPISSSTHRLYSLPIQKGFTLVELLLYMGIFTILMTVFIQMFGDLINTQLDSNATTSVSTNTKYILARFSYDIERAESVTSPTVGVSGQSLQLTQNGTTVTYASNSGNLIITNENGTDQLNDTDTTISNLSFTPLGSSNGKLSVKINLTLSSRTLRKGGNLQTEQLQTTIGLR